MKKLKGLFGSKKALGILLALLVVIILVIVGVKAGFGKAFLVAVLVAVFAGLIFALKKYGSNPKIKAALIAGLVIMGLIILSVLFGAGRIFGAVFLLVIIAAILIALILMWKKGWLNKTVRIVLTIVGILLIILLIVSLFGNLFKGAGKGSTGVLNGNTNAVATIDNTADQTDNGIKITVYGNESDAKANPYSSELVGYSLLAIVDDSEAAKITVTGTSSGVTGSAASDNWLGNLTTSSTYAVAYDSRTAAGVEWFIIDSNQFEEGEVVLVTIETSANNSVFAKKFAQQTNNTSVYYWSFTAKHGNNTGTAPEESADNSTGANPSNSYVAGTPGSIVVNQNNGTVGYVVLDGQPYGTYNTFEEAWDNATAISSSTPYLTCIPFGSTQSIDVTVHEAAGYPSIEAHYLGYRTTWSETLNLSGSAGKTVVLKVLYLDGPQHDVQYVGFMVPAN